MRHLTSAGLLAVAFAVVLEANAAAQTPASPNDSLPSLPESTAADSATQATGSATQVTGSGPFADGHVIQATGSGTVASRVLQRATYLPVAAQVKFEIQILRVDTETRDRFYSELDPDRVDTEIAAAGEWSQQDANEPIGPELSSRHTVDTGSIVTAAVLNRAEVQRFYALAKESGNSEVVAKPQIIAAVGQVAGIQQQVQRPFLSAVEEVQTGDHKGIQSEMQVLGEGTDFAVQGDLEDGAIRVRARMRHARVIDVEEHRVYGVGAGQTTIQVPSHEVRQAVASQRLMPGETLLLDPYITKTVAVAESVPQPVIGKIPYVKDTFSQTRAVKRTTHLLVLLKAAELKR